MYCKQCGNMIQTNYRFCSGCGSGINIENNTTASMCIKCKGTGEMRSIIRIIIGMVISFCLFIASIILLTVHITVTVLFFSCSLYSIIWSFKRKTCKVCHGSGRYYM